MIERMEYHLRLSGNLGIYIHTSELSTACKQDLHSYIVSFLWCTVAHQNQVGGSKVSLYLRVQDHVVSSGSFT